MLSEQEEIECIRAFNKIVKWHNGEIIEEASLTDPRENEIIISFQGISALNDIGKKLL